MNLPQRILKRERAGAQPFVLSSSWEGGEMVGAVEAVMDHEATLRTEELGSLITSWHCHPYPGSTYSRSLLHEGKNTLFCV